MTTRKRVDADHARLDRVVAEARRARSEREQGYRARALKLFPWICGRCAREFDHGNDHELTVHHKNHDHDHNPADGSNWELLCLYCHDNEHQRQLDTRLVAGTDRVAGTTHTPFVELGALLQRDERPDQAPGGSARMAPMPQDHFADKSAEWDTRPIPLQISTAVGPLLRECLDWNDGMRVMDFGAGTGLLTSYVAPMVAKVVAVDTSPSMLEALVRKPELQGVVEPRCQDILAEPLDERVDAIVSAMAMHHVNDTDRLFGTFREHLKPGGQLALADLDTEDGTFHPPDTAGVFHHGFDREDLRRKLEAAGFERVRFRTAVDVTREDGRSYPVFLLTARAAAR